MSIWSSLFTSSSGISAYGQAMGVVGDNVANVGTTGFKGSRAGFAAILGGIGSNQQRVGAGVLMSGAEVGFGQGSLQQTGQSLDMAVWGEGWFVLDGNHKGVQGEYFTRDGHFGMDNEGFLVNPGGLRLQGYQYDDNAQTFSPVLGDLNMPSTMPPNATSELNIQVRLDNALQNAAGVTGPPTDPAKYETSVKVYDEDGRPHDVVVKFSNQLDGQGNPTDTWQWVAELDGGEINGGVAGTPSSLGGGDITFASDGTYQSSTGNITADFVGNAGAQILTPDFTGSNQYAGDFDLQYNQDGYAAGTSQDFMVDEDGIIEAIYSNGEARKVGRVALATFKGEAELERTGSQLFRETPSSGNPSIGVAASAGRGSIAGGSLEGSNVDLGTELVTMITYQRAFQANARAVSTADEMLAETANLKR